MHDAILWVGWYLLLLTVPFCIIGSLVRESLAHRRAVRHVKGTS